jgi:gas vesicle protein
MHDDKGYPYMTVLGAFLGGALFGAGAALLLAPKAGSETRGELKAYAKRAKDEVLEKAEAAEDLLESGLEQGRQLVSEKKAAMAAAIQAGRDALRKESA